MESLYILIPIAMIFVFIALAIFIWAVKSDQFDDLDRHGMNILFEEEKQKSSSQIPPLQTDENKEKNQ